MRGGCGGEKTANTQLQQPTRLGRRRIKKTETSTNSLTV